MKLKRTADELQEKQLSYELKIIKQELTDTFVQFFVNILGGYRSCISRSSFDRDRFINEQPPESCDVSEKN
jgi:hypothetical protein